VLVAELEPSREEVSSGKTVFGGKFSSVSEMRMQRRSFQRGVESREEDASR
jgi:hypothetical protein